MRDDFCTAHNEQRDENGVCSGCEGHIALLLRDDSTVVRTPRAVFRRQPSPFESGTGFVDCELHPFSEGRWGKTIPVGSCPICEREEMRQRFGPKGLEPDRIDRMELT